MKIRVGEWFDFSCDASDFMQYLVITMFAVVIMTVIICMTFYHTTALAVPLTKPPAKTTTIQTQTVEEPARP